MSDILVRLYALPAWPPDPEGVVVRRPMAHEKDVIKAWITQHFGLGWASEYEVAFAHQPPSCFIAQAQATGHLLGFACYEVTARGFFGPTGVLPSERGRGLGTVLLLRSLYALRELGYAYTIIGDAGPAAFYERTVGGVLIPDSNPGIYPMPPLVDGA